MIFETRFKELMEKHPIPPDTKLWLHSSIYGLVVCIICLLYIGLTRGQLTMRVLNLATANAAFLLIGISFILSSVCYFWNFADRYFVYRKHIGLVGFLYAVIHTVLSIISSQRFGPFPAYFLREDNIAPFVSAVIALVILTFMAAISNRYAINEMGGKNWRLALRTGYIAYFFSIVHFALKSYDDWLEWLMGGTSFPPLSLIVVLFGILVLGLRIALWIALLMKKTAQTPTTH